MSDEVAVDRRRGRRRSLPFVRSAVLEVDGRHHIVAVNDIGPDGAFLSARVAVPPASQLRLKLVIPGTSTEVEIPCRLVWRTGDFDAMSARPEGIAVRFEELPASISRRIGAFVHQRIRPAVEPAPVDHFEYRIVERPEIAIDELNRLGLDGWLLTAAVPTEAGVRLILVRRV